MKNRTPYSFHTLPFIGLWGGEGFLVFQAPDYLVQKAEHFYGALETI